MIILSAVVSVFVITPLAYMFADNQPPYEYGMDGSYVVPQHTQSGHQLRVHWKLKKVNRICIGSITRVIVDDVTGFKISYDPTPATKNIDMEDGTLDRTFYLPPLISPGRKWYYSDAEFACNLLQRLYPLRVRTPRLGFEVTE